MHTDSSSAVLTLRDLELWSFDGTALAVLGHPIAHSVSPPMHNAALAEAARTQPELAKWRYFRFDVPPEQLPEALTALHRRRFRGVNLTVPHKILAFSRVQEIDPAAKPIGAVNTLRRTETGWQGFNTDGYGLSAALKEDLAQELRGSRVILLGAGGAARSAAVEALQRGCAELWIANRTRENLNALLETLKPLVKNGTVVRGFAPDAAPSDLPAHAIVINATSAGLKGNDSLPADLTHWPRPAAVFDMIYNPPRTPFLQQAERLRLPVANGLSMLVHQGAKSLEIWSGVPAARSAAAMSAAARAALKL